jgi:crotonobetainyl-CoA:carnitine CoA-transferase CaiB-like acyl-CoA transferase
VVADKVSALTGVYAILAALFHRERTGVGQAIEVPMFETMVSFNMVEHLSGAIYEEPISRPLYSRVVSRNRRPYRTKTDYISAMVHTDRHLARFCKLIGRPEIPNDERFSNVSARTKNVALYYQFLEDEFAKRPAAEWVALLEEAEIPVQRIIPMDELFDDPHLTDVGFFKEVHQPGDGKLRIPGFPADFSMTPAQTCVGVPTLGEHTFELLRAAGWSREAVEELLASGAAVSGEPIPESASGQKIGPAVDVKARREAQG